MAASAGSSSCASGSGAKGPDVLLVATGMFKLDFRPGREGRFLPEIVCTKEMTASVASFEGRYEERIAIRDVDRNREGFFVLIRGCSIARRLTRVQNLSVEEGSDPASFSFSSSSSSSRSSSCIDSVTFRTTSLGFPSRAIVSRHLCEPGIGSSR